MSIHFAFGRFTRIVLMSASSASIHDFSSRSSQLSATMTMRSGACVFVVHADEIGAPEASFMGSPVSAQNGLSGLAHSVMWPWWCHLSSQFAFGTIVSKPWFHHSIER